MLLVKGAHKGHAHDNYYLLSVVLDYPHKNLLYTCVTPRPWGSTHMSISSYLWGVPYIFREAINHSFPCQALLISTTIVLNNYNIHTKLMIYVPLSSSSIVTVTIEGLTLL